MTEVFGCPKCALQILMNVGSTFIFIVFYSVVYLLTCCLYPPSNELKSGPPRLARPRPSLNLQNRMQQHTADVAATITALPAKNMSYMK